MADPFVAEIRIFAGNFAPLGWAFCNGQILPLSQNTALFSLLGTMYGGDGRSTFALPDLQGRAPMHHGQGPGLSERFQGETSGAEAVALLTSEIPSHTHTVSGTSVPGSKASPAGNLWAAGSGRTPPSMYQSNAPNTPMAPTAVGIQGGDQPHNNMQPYLTVNFIIALQGVFPPRG